MRRGIDYPGVTVCFRCHDGNGEYLLAKRSDQCRDEHGCWDFGGGSIELGHGIEDTLRKEIKEEYCTDILSFEFLGYKDIFREFNSERHHWVALVFEVHVNRKKAKIGEPHKFTDIGWFSLDNLPDPLHSQISKDAEGLKNKLL